MMDNSKKFLSQQIHPPHLRKIAGAMHFRDGINCEAACLSGL